MKRKNVLRMLVLLTVLGFGTLFQLQANLAPPTAPTAPTPPTDTTDNNSTDTGRPSFWDPSELANIRFLHGINRRQVTNTLHPSRRI